MPFAAAWRSAGVNRLSIGSQTFDDRVLAWMHRLHSADRIGEAVRKLSAQPAHNLGLRERGQLRPGWFADVVVFDPATIQDHATFEKPHQFATGVSEVVVNGQLALEKGEPTAATTAEAARNR